MVSEATISQYYCMLRAPWNAMASAMHCQTVDGIAQGYCANRATIVPISPAAGETLAITATSHTIDSVRVPLQGVPFPPAPPIPQPDFPRLTTLATSGSETLTVGAKGH